MDAWTPRPNRGEHTTQIEMVRSKPGPARGGIVTTDDIVGAYTHFWKGRTTICTFPECDACDHHRTPRWYGYLAIIAEATKVPAIIELTPTCIPPVEEYLAEYGTLRGATVTLQRANKKINSRVLCTLRPSGYDKGVLPQPVNVRAHLAKIWELTAVQDVIPLDHGHHPITNGRIRNVAPPRPSA